MSVKAEGSALDGNRIKHFERSLKRVFSLPVTRSTFRQLQNVILAIVDSDKELANTLFESLLTGEIKEGLAKGSQEQDALKKVIDEFSVPAWVAKDVFEKGEFINIISSDIVQQQNRLLYANTLRRIDGEELQFLTDFESTLQVIHHFVQRLRESKERFDVSKELFNNFQKELAGIKNNLDDLLKK